MLRYTALMLVLSTVSALADAPLKSALDGNAPPFAMPTLDGNIQGLTVDMTAEVSKRIGRDITLQAMPFSGLIPALQAGTFDMLSVPMTATAERAQVFALTEGIWSADYGFLVPKGQEIATADQLKGKTIAVNKGTVYDQWARDNAEKYGWKVDSYASVSDSAQAVQARRADAALMGQSSAVMIVQKNPAFDLAEYVITSGVFYSYAFPKESVELRNQVEDAIECIKADGTAAKLYEKWLKMAPAAGSLDVTPQVGYGPVGLPGHDATPHELNCK